MELIFLGTSGMGISTHRNLPAYIIDKSILVDCGEGCVQNLLKNQILVNNINAIFLTHLHADHCLGLISLLWKQAYYSNQREQNEIRYSPPIFVPLGMKKHLIALLEHSFSDFSSVGFEVIINELPLTCKTPLEFTFDFHHYKISWTRINHSPLTYAYKFNSKLIIGGDTSPSEELVDFIFNSNILVHEATFPDEKCELAHKLNHSTPKDAAKIAAEGEVGKLILTHVPLLKPYENNTFLQKAKNIFPSIDIAEDNDRFIF